MPAGTVLFTSRAPIGYVAIAKRAVCTNQGFKSFVPTAVMSAEYLYWYLVWATPSIRNLGSGTTFAEISGKVARTIPLLLPPRREQGRIVAAIEEQFSRLDAGVAALERAKRKLPKLRMSALQAALEPSARDRNWPQFQLADVAEVQLGRQRSPKNPGLLT
jgi:type I restriction enzyme S subunit